MVEDNQKKHRVLSFCRSYLFKTGAPKKLANLRFRVFICQFIYALGDGIAPHRRLYSFCRPVKYRNADTKVGNSGY